MSKQRKGYCLVTDTGKFHSKTVSGAVVNYLTDSLNPFKQTVATGKDYNYKLCVVCKDGSGYYYGDTVPELLTEVATHRLSHFLAGEGWRD